MGKKLYPTDTLVQARKFLSVWKLIDPALKIGPLTLESMTADVAAVQGLQERIIHLQRELINIRNQRDAATICLWNNVKRARSGLKGIYRDDATEYGLAGGTARSERQKLRRKSVLVSAK